MDVKSLLEKREGTTLIHFKINPKFDEMDISRYNQCFAVF